MRRQRSASFAQCIFIACLFACSVSGRGLFESPEPSECNWSEGLDRCTASPKVMKAVLKEMAVGVSDDVVDWLACQLQQTQEGCAELGCTWFSTTCSLASLPDPTNLEFLKRCYGNAAVFFDAINQSRKCKTDYKTKKECGKTTVCNWKDGACKFDVFKALGAPSKFLPLFSIKDRTVRNLLSKTLSCNFQQRKFFCERKEGCSWDKDEKDCELSTSYAINQLLTGGENQDDPQCKIAKIALESECRTKKNPTGCGKASNCEWKEEKGYCDTDQSFLGRALFSGYDNFSEALKKKDAVCEAKPTAETCSTA